MWVVYAAVEIHDPLEWPVELRGWIDQGEVVGFRSYPEEDGTESIFLDCPTQASAAACRADLTSQWPFRHAARTRDAMRVFRSARATAGPGPKDYPDGQQR